ncbi:MAG: 1-deoxy-D-xylulose-5-phosphate reductoisomerase [Negativicutes bacterium]|nr:1-deoxy-D-xylulose-5-phosphate reductoisomerase [Negativicutes bacterium]
MKKLSVLGSTGSIGRQTLEVCANNPGEFAVVALAANASADAMAGQIETFRPSLAAMRDRQAAGQLQKICRERGLKTEVLGGDEGLEAVAAMPEADMVVAAMVGFAGLRPVMAAIAAGKDIALANKETLVAAGHIVMPAVVRHGVRLLPVDSEHSAILQCLPGGEPRAISRLILTASGGPFYGYGSEQLSDVTVEAVLKHPNWVMGSKITVDSATMANKGLEVIEAHQLFGVDYNNIDVVVHRQSIVHSLVEFRDGSVIAQLGLPDMRLPIQYALSFPDRLPQRYTTLSLAQLGSLSFAPPDNQNFPMLPLAIAAGRRGGGWPCAFNAANEEAVFAFLRRELSFQCIHRLCDQVLQEIELPDTVDDLDAVEAVDSLARAVAGRVLKRFSGGKGR